MGVVSGSGVYGVSIWIPCVGDDVAGDGPDPKRRRQLLRYRSCGSGVEGGNINFNCRFTTSITHHKLLHGFRVVWGTGIPTLEVKLL